MPSGSRPDHGRERESEEDAANRVTASLAGLALALVLIVLSLSVTDHLRRMVSLQDCVLSGRTDCTIARP
jgi:hypothetical protein